MPDRSFEEIRMIEFQAILDNIRYECLDLVDDYYLAFVESGRPWSEWNTVAEYERSLFRATKTEKLTFEERRGALKLIRAYLKDRIETLKLEGMYAAEGRHG